SGLPEGRRCSTQGEAARQGGALSQELSSSSSFLAHWCSPGRLTPRNRSKLPIVYTHIRSATRMLVSRRSWVRRSSATSRGGVPSGVPTPSPWQPHDAQPSVAPDVLRLASPSLRPHCSDSGLWFAPLWNNPRGRTMRGCGHLDSERRSAI